MECCCRSYTWIGESFYEFKLKGSKCSLEVRSSPGFEDEPQDADCSRDKAFIDDDLEHTSLSALMSTLKCVTTRQS